MNPKELKIGDKVTTIDGKLGVVANMNWERSPYIVYVDVGEIKAYLGWQLEV